MTACGALVASASTAAIGSDGLELVSTVARQVARRLADRVDSSDLASLGLLVLCEAARRHDPDRTAFTPYLVDRLRWAMMSDARRQVRRDRLIGRFRGLDAEGAGRDAFDEAEAGAALERDDPESCPHAALEAREAKARLRLALAALPFEHRTVLVRLYFAGERLEDIRDDLGRSKATLSRVHLEGLRSLHAALDDLATSPKPAKTPRRAVRRRGPSSSSAEEPHEPAMTRQRKSPMNPR
jgi:RNA polymerase sigma factor (sigma-70 family)